MTTKSQFNALAKTRNHHSDMIQVRYVHPDGENYDAFVSGEEALARLNTRARERLIKSFSVKNWEQAKRAVEDEARKGETAVRETLTDRLGDFVQDQVGGNIFGDTLADNLRGVDSRIDPRDAEKALWKSRLQDSEFRNMILHLAWLDIGDILPPEDTPAEDDDWV